MIDRFREGWKSAGSGWTAAWLAAAVLLAVIFYPGDSSLRFTAAGDFLSKFVPAGKLLAYGIHSENLNYSMPLINTASLLAGEGNPWRFSLFWGAVLLLYLCLSFSLGCLLHSRAAGLLAAAAAFFPPFQKFWFFDVEQRLYAVTLLLAANALALPDGQKPWKKYLLLGLSVWLSLMVRSPLCLFPPVLIAVEYFRRGAEKPASFFKRSALLLSVVILFLLPWVRLNYFLLDRFIPFENSRTEIHMVTGSMGILSTVEGDYRKLAGIPAGESPAAWAVKNAASHPARYLAGAARRVKHIFSINPLLIILWLAAFFYSPRNKKAAGVNLLIIYFLAVHCLVSMEERYISPAWTLMCAVIFSTLVEFLYPWEDKSAENTGKLIFAPAFLCVFALGIYTQSLVLLYPYRAGAYTADLKLARQRNPGDPWLLYETGRLEMSGKMYGDALVHMGEAYTRLGCPFIKFDFAKALAIKLGKKAGPFIKSNINESDRRGDDLFRRDYFLLETIYLLEYGHGREAADFYKKAKTRWESGIIVRKFDSRPEPEMQERLRNVDLSFFTSWMDMLKYWPPERQLKILKAIARLPGPLRDLENFIKRNPGDREARVILSILYEAGNRRREAENCLAYGMPSAEREKLWEKALEESARLRKEFDYVKARLLLNVLSALKPESGACLAETAEVDSDEGKQESAAENLLKAVKLEPRYPQAWALLALLYLDPADYKRSLDILQKASRETDMRRTAGFILDNASAFALDGDYEKSAALLQLLTKLNLKDTEISGRIDKLAGALSRKIKLKI